MLFIIFVLTLLLVLLIVQRFFIRNKTQVIPSHEAYQIDSKEFGGFENCNTIPKLHTTKSRLIKEVTPIKKEYNTLTFEIKSEVMGLPIKAIMLGVCELDNSSQACGWGSFMAVVIPRPLSEVRNQLKKEKGIDFTEEIRDKESEVTLRPVLAPGQNSNESVLYCDPGIL